MSLQQRIEQYRSPAVRDLVWALLSPSQIQSPDASHNLSPRWYEEAFTTIEPHLQQLDTDDSALQKHLQEPENHRLGIYFERLWSYWLQHNGRYQLLASNQQVMHNGKTRGEFDFIVKDAAADQIEHWELAVKFYLGIPPLDAPPQWFGPNIKDRLDLKYRHLIDKQLPLSQTQPGLSACQAHGWQVRQRRLISKGRLYFPFPHHSAAPGCIEADHLHGFWLDYSGWKHHARHFSGAGYNWLTKSEWMVWRPRPLQSYGEIQQRLEQQLHPHPVQLRVEGWMEQPIRLFLVPDDWSATALASLQAR